MRTWGEQGFDVSGDTLDIRGDGSSNPHLSSRSIPSRLHADGSHARDDHRRGQHPLDDAALHRLHLPEPPSRRHDCEGVEAFTVRMEPMRSAASIRTGGRWDLLKRATIL